MDNPHFGAYDIGGTPRRNRRYVEAGRRLVRVAARSAIVGAARYLLPPNYSQDDQSRVMSYAPTPSTLYNRRYRSYGPVPRPVKKYVKRCMRLMAETKEAIIEDIVGNGGVPTTAGRVDPIQTFMITQGSTDSTREGNHLQIDKLYLRGRAVLPDDQRSAVFRVIVFRDSQTNGASPAYSDILVSTNPFAGYNGDNVNKVGGRRFRILFDTLFTINSGSSHADAGATPTAIKSTETKRIIQRSFKGPFNVHFDASAGAITDIVSGEIFVLSISDNNTAIVQFTSQIKFIDG